VKHVLQLSVAVSVTALLMTSCGRPTGGGATSSLPPVPMEQPLKRRIEGIETMSFEDLTRWVAVCAPYNASPATMARNPYDQSDCDRVQIRRSEWTTSQTQRPAEFLPKVH